jgi:surface antigen
MIAALLALSACAGGPSSAKPAKPGLPPAEAKEPAKTAKTRVVQVKVPVLVKETTRYADGLVDSYTVYATDAGAKRLLEKNKYDPSRGAPIERTAYEYENGRQKAESVYEFDGSLRSRRELGYDSAGRLATERLLDAKDSVISASAYAYDPSGRKIEWRVLDASGAVKASTVYAYGPYGPVSAEMRDAAGAVTGRIASEYEGERLVRRVYAGQSGEVQKVESFAYAGQSPAPSSVELRKADGSIIVKTAYEYGSLGEVVKATELLPSGATGSYTTYEYTMRTDSVTETYFE